MPADKTNDESINWYVVNTYAGQENRVKENLEKRIKSMGLEDSLFDVVVAEETETEYKNGKEIKKTHNLFSGYILVRMRMTNEAWYIVRNTPGVTGFIGSSGKGAKPFPVSQEEVDNVLSRLHRPQDNVTVDLIPGDYAEVLDGAIKGNIVKVVSVDPTSRQAKVSFSMMGKQQLTDIDLKDLKKVDRSENA
ncbi:transcription termination/antitermination protein NusG [Allobaculum mucilyticum]|uniref:transcription termination/antitermination protein NusG n=1 Tax=Allobaculum mucilyticum TaxID=2834459 RepID=UPI001E30A4F5|nr:transcription termination/antitermination protein NusG [Allobaculum mucilyticum]UNT95912.1 transcription termination/antitermination protein NusG [Allobaculum mucilyticum]